MYTQYTNDFKNVLTLPELRDRGGGGGRQTQLFFPNVVVDTDFNQIYRRTLYKQDCFIGSV